MPPPAWNKLYQSPRGIGLTIVLLIYTIVFFSDATHWHIFIIMDTVFSYLVLCDVTKVLL